MAIDETYEAHEILRLTRAAIQYGVAVQVCEARGDAEAASLHAYQRDWNAHEAARVAERRATLDAIRF